MGRIVWRWWNAPSRSPLPSNKDPRSSQTIYLRQRLKLGLVQPPFSRFEEPHAPHPRNL